MISAVIESAVKIMIELIELSPVSGEVGCTPTAIIKLKSDSAILQPLFVFSNLHSAVPTGFGSPSAAEYLNVTIAIALFTPARIICWFLITIRNRKIPITLHKAKSSILNLGNFKCDPIYYV